MEKQGAGKENTHTGKRKTSKIFFILGCIIILFGGLYLIDLVIYKQLHQESPSEGMTFGKPVIYLYPEQESEIYVRLYIVGELIADYPKYNQSLHGWNVIASPNSQIINKEDNKEYSYLFWEGLASENINWKRDSGFVVPGNQTREFLQDILPKIGLTPKEYNEFIVYWYPLLQNNPYNLIYFAGEEYTKNAVLTTSPKYDSILRVFMVVQPLEAPIEVDIQEFSPFKRDGFTVVEWGGTILQ